MFHVEQNGNKWKQRPAIVPRGSYILYKKLSAKRSSIVIDRKEEAGCLKRKKEDPGLYACA